MSSISIKFLHLLANELGVSPDSLIRNAELENDNAEGAIARACGGDAGATRVGGVVPRSPERVVGGVRGADCRRSNGSDGR